MNTLLVEIVTEEIPAGYIPPALKALEESMLAKLDEARIGHGPARSYGTPRRLALEVRDVADKQPPSRTTLVGPPERAAFDSDGKTTMAAVKFAEKAGVPVNRLGVQDTPKGRYLCAEIVEKGRPVKALLGEMLPNLILSIPFPKTMRWADLSISFARPIRSILALYGREVIPFTVGNVRSGRRTSGHRFMASKALQLNHADEYEQALENAHVIADVTERKERIRQGVAAEAAKRGGSVLPDEDLLDLVTNLVEAPYPVAGKFDEKYLELPKEVLITAMREHQKYFAVADASGALLPGFIAVNNTLARDLRLAAGGHERVLRARLEDARFFYKSDLKHPMDTWVEKLDGVMFQAKLGSMRAKVGRIVKTVDFLADRLDQTALKTEASRAAGLCKADLVSEMVGEFPKLQGVMGRVYARVAGETPAVAAAIEEHYRPAYSGGPLPESMIGALVGIADKMDSICGCFSIDFIPTGASDPYALRRQAIGILQIMKERRIEFPLGAVIDRGLRNYEGIAEPSIEAIAAKIYEFLRGRLNNLLVEEGYPKDIVSAVTAVSIDCVPDAWQRADALTRMRQAPDFGPLAAAFKRVGNILKKTEEKPEGPAEPRLFEDEAESRLLDAVAAVKNRLRDRTRRTDYYADALLALAGLREPVDAFFERVMVMCEKPEVRRNRLALLAMIGEAFRDIADFTKLST